MTAYKSVLLPYSNISILQDEKSHAITTDTQFLVESVLKSEFFTVDSNLNVLEIGTGNGIISIMLALARKNWRLTAIEVQIPIFFLALENVSSANVDIDFRLADVRQYKRFLKDEKFSLILANPPYYKIGSGKLSQDINKNIGRFEFLCDINDIFNCLSYNLQDDGFAYLLYPALRSREVYQKAVEHSFQVVAEKAVTPGNMNLNSQKRQHSNTKVLFVLRNIHDNIGHLRG